MRVLSEDDITRLLPMAQCVPLMEEALAALSRGDARLPLRSVVRLPRGHDVLAWMPAYATGPTALGAKVITVFPENQHHGLDAHQGAVLLFDPEDGRLLALLDASSITAIRTAAVSAVATRLLARPDASSLALLGSRVQAWTHLEAMLLVRPIATVRVWSRTPDHAADFVRRARDAFEVDIATAASAEEAVLGADIVCTVTAARQPVLRGAWLQPGTHVNAVGASQPDARELDVEAMARARVFADRRESLMNESAAYRAALDEGRIADGAEVPEIGEVLAGTAAGRTSADEITLFKSLGLAVEDLFAGRHVLRRAEAEGAGTVVALGGG